MNFFTSLDKLKNQRNWTSALWVKAESHDSTPKHDYANEKTILYFKGILSHVMHQFGQIITNSLQTYILLAGTTLAFAEGVDFSRESLKQILSGR